MSEIVVPRFGWIPPDERSPEMQAWHLEECASMPVFRILGKANDDTKKAVLWDCSKEAVKLNPALPTNGEHFMVFRQVTGSCVGNGLGQATWYLSAVEVVRLHDAEQVLLPFYLLPYGRSRYYAGMRGRGDGSLGSAGAKAVRTDGILSALTEGLPKFTSEGGISWGERAEYDWSDGAAIDNKWLDMSRKHLVKTTAQMNSADDCRMALQNYYPLTIASMWGGRMECPTEGTPPVLLNERVTSWAHQMCVIGWWEHPTLGEIFYVLNSWGKNAHGTDPSGAPQGGFWIRKRDMERIVSENETFAFSQFDGFPAPAPDFLDWINAA